MSLFISRVSNSTSLLLTPLSVAAGGYIGSLALWERVHVWDNAVSAIVTAMLVVGPIHAAGAAWDAGQEVRSGVAVYRRLSPERHFRARLIDLSVAGSAATLSFIFLTLWFLVGATPSTWGSPNWLWLSGAGVGLLAQTSLGVLFGSLLPYRVTAPISAIVLFFGNQALIQFLPAIGLSNAGWLAFGREQQQNLFAQIDYPLIALQLIWYVGVVALVVGVLAVLARAARTSTAIIAAVAVAALLVGGVGTQASRSNFFLPVERDFTYSCDATRTICVHPAFAVGLPEISSAAAAMKERVAGTPFAISVFEQRPRGVGGVPDEGLAIHIDNLDDGWVGRDLGEASQELIDVNLGPYGPCKGSTTTSEDGNIVGFGSIVSSWIADEPELAILITPDQVDAAARFALLTDEEKRAWLGEHRDELCAAALSPESFP